MIERKLFYVKRYILGKSTLMIGDAAQYTVVTYIKYIKTEVNQSCNSSKQST